MNIFSLIKIIMKKHIFQQKSKLNSFNLITYRINSKLKIQIYLNIIEKLNQAFNNESKN